MRNLDRIWESEVGPRLLIAWIASLFGLAAAYRPSIAILGAVSIAAIAALILRLTISVIGLTGLLLLGSSTSTLVPLLNGSFVLALSAVAIYALVRVPWHRDPRITNILIASGLVLVYVGLAAVVGLARGQSIEGVARGSFSGLLLGIFPIAGLWGYWARTNLGFAAVLILGISSVASFAQYLVIRGAIDEGILNYIPLPSGSAAVALMGYSIARAAQAHVRAAAMWLMVACAALLSQILTGSRASGVAMIVAFVVVALTVDLPLRRSPRLLALGVLGLSMIGLSYLNLGSEWGTIGARVDQLGNPIALVEALDEVSVIERRNQNAAAIRLVRSSPLLGAGAGVEFVFYRQHLRQEVHQVVIDSSLAPVARGGIVGASFLIMGLVVILRSLWELAGPHVEIRAALLGLGVFSAVGFPFRAVTEEQGLSLVLFVLVATALARSRRSRNGPLHPSRDSIVVAR